MIIWGGGEYFIYPYLFVRNTGARYNPSTDTWTATNNSNPPTGRVAHTAVWTGTEMIIWGGAKGCSALQTPVANTIQTATQLTATYNQCANRTRGTWRVDGQRNDRVGWRGALNTGGANPNTLIAGQLPALLNAPDVDGVQQRYGPEAKWSYGVELVTSPI
jgi:hypothetical protein